MEAKAILIARPRNSSSNATSHRPHLTRQGDLSQQACLITFHGETGIPGWALPTHLGGVNTNHHLSAPPAGRKGPTNGILPEGTLLPLNSRRRAAATQSQGALLILGSTALGLEGRAAPGDFGMPAWQRGGARLQEEKAGPCVWGQSIIIFRTDRALPGRGTGKQAAVGNGWRESGYLCSAETFMSPWWLKIRSSCRDNHAGRNPEVRRRTQSLGEDRRCRGVWAEKEKTP